jgi:N-acetylmuramoyl-L-alanine amidase
MRRRAVFTLVAFACMGSSALAGNLSGKTVVIDPGHNGGNTSHHEITGKQVWAGTLWKDCDADGASTDSGYSEAQHNWDVALLVRAMLRAQGARVVLTRTSNAGAGPCITRRAAIGNQFRADAAVSIHADGNLNASNTGFHVILPADTGQSQRMLRGSQRLGLAIRNALRDQGPTAISNYIGSDGLITRSDLGGLNLSKVPKVFTEIGNMHAPHDAAAMTSPAGRQLEASAIAAGITNFLTSRRG